MLAPHNRRRHLLKTALETFAKTNVCIPAIMNRLAASFVSRCCDAKERQDQQAKPTIKSNSDKNGYVKHALRRAGGRTS